MSTVALLRGVNVGGNRKVPMATLRELLEGLGLKNVRTLLQSGNAVFEGRCTAKKIEDALETAFGFRPAVMLRSTAEMNEVVARNPFARRTDVPPDRLLITFFNSEPNPIEIEASPEEVHVLGREMYTYFPNGMGQTKFPFAAVERKLGVTGTGRNWNTVAKLAAMG